MKQVSPTWEADARRRIRRADQVPVICGHYTDTATGVNKEIRIAREESKPYFLLGGRASGTNKKPTAATDHRQDLRVDMAELEEAHRRRKVSWTSTRSGSSYTNWPSRWRTEFQRDAPRQTASLWP